MVIAALHCLRIDPGQTSDHWTSPPQRAGADQQLLYKHLTVSIGNHFFFFSFVCFLAWLGDLCSSPAIGRPCHWKFCSEFPFVDWVLSSFSWINLQHLIIHRNEYKWIMNAAKSKFSFSLHAYSWMFLLTSSFLTDNRHEWSCQRSVQKQISAALRADQSNQLLPVCTLDSIPASPSHLKQFYTSFVQGTLGWLFCGQGELLETATLK